MERSQGDVQDLVRLLSTRIVVLTIFAVAGVGIGVVLALVLDKIYRAETVVALAASEARVSGASSLLGQFEGLAGMAGLNLGGGDPLHAVAVLESKAFTESFIERHELLPVLFSDKWDATAKAWVVDEDKKPSIRDGRRLIERSVRRITEDSTSGLIRMTIDWTDPDLAAQWANQMIADANSQLKEQALSEAQRSIAYLEEQLSAINVIEVRQAVYRLLEQQLHQVMLADVRREYAFKVIDPAVPPERDDQIRPKPLVLIVIGFTLGILVAVVFVLSSRRYGINEGLPAKQQLQCCVRRNCDKSEIYRMALKEKAIRKFAILTWSFWERIGFHVSPNHFYWPIPDSRNIRHYNFDRHFVNDGIRLDEKAMLDTLARIGEYRSEYEAIHERTGYSSNGDGSVLYGMIRQTPARHIVEVGAGHSTQIIQAAIKRNSKESGIDPARITSIEPYPKNSLLSLVSGSPSTITLVREPVQNVPISLFQSLRKNDVLFIDSSHVLAIGNDVHYLYLRVLPLLAPGVIVHIHDIRYPQDYPRNWVIDQKKFWTEQYLLQAFLAFNTAFEVTFASNYMYRAFPELMKQALVDLPSIPAGWPGSFWIRRTE